MENDDKTMKPEGNIPPGKMKKLGQKLDVSFYMTQLATAFGQTVESERINLYGKALNDLTEQQVAYGFEQALKYFRPDFGKTFPLPAEIRDWALEWRPKIETTRLLLDRGDKPPDWEPMTSEEAAAWIETLRERRSKDS